MLTHTAHGTCVILHGLHCAACFSCRGVWFPNQKLDEPPAMTPAVLLSSSFAQEQYITMPAHQLVAMPGTYMLQVRMRLQQGLTTLYALACTALVCNSYCKPLECYVQLWPRQRSICNA